jgi:hypothetical protein
MKMMLSEFIEKLAKGSNHENVTNIVASLRAMLATKGDIEIDVDHMYRILDLII